MAAAEAEEPQTRSVRQRRLSLASQAAVSLPTRLWHGDILRSTAAFLPVEDQFGTLRAVSRNFYKELPPFPKEPDPAFHVRFNDMSRGPSMVMELGTHTLSTMRAFLTNIQNGKTMLPVRGTVSSSSQNNLEFFYTPLNQIPFPDSHEGTLYILSAAADYYVSLVNTDAAAPDRIELNHPRKFIIPWDARIRGPTFPTIDVILRALWRAYATKEKARAERERRLLISQEVLHVLPAEVIGHEVLPFLPYHSRRPSL